MDTFFPSDAEFIATLPSETLAKFEAWFAELDREHEKQGINYCGGSLAKSTGIECWFSYFEDGYDPDEAIAEDASYD